MATFTDPNKLKKYADYKPLLKAAVARLKADAAVDFQFWEKHAFDDKERALLLVDAAKKVVEGLAKPTAKGECHVDAQDRVVLTVTQGTVKYGPAAKLLADAGATRALKLPAEADAPLADKLDVTLTWGEWASWPAEDAKVLGAASDALLKAFRELPAPPPDQADLKGRHADLKLAIAALVSTPVENNPVARKAALQTVQALQAQAQQLAEKIGRRADKLSAAQTGAPTKPVTPTATRRPEPDPAPTRTSPDATRPAPPDDRPDPEAEKRRLERVAEQQRQQELAARRTRERQEAVKEALKALAAERRGFDALETQLVEIGKKLAAAKDRSALLEVGTLSKDCKAAVKKQLSRSGFKKLAPANDGFDAFEDALKGADGDEQVPVSEVNAVLDRLEALAGLRSDLDDRRAELDPVVREKRTAARVVRGWIHTSVLAEAQRKGTLKDIVGIIGQERRGRTSPNGVANHVHVGGDANYNVIFHEQGEAVRVLGFVNGHMDRNMPPPVRSAAARVEERASGGNGDFTEVEVNLGTRVLTVVGAT